MNDVLADRPVETETGQEEVLCGGFKRMVRHRNRHRTSEGSWSNWLTRDLHEGGRVAAVIAHDPARDELVLIRQYRLAAHRATGLGGLVEIVAGGVEPGEDARAAAIRELREETGLEARNLVHCFDFMPSPGITEELASVFLAEVDASALPARAGEDEDEDIVPFTAKVDDIIAAMDEGRLHNGFLLLALNWFARRRAEGKFMT